MWFDAWLVTIWWSMMKHLSHQVQRRGGWQRIQCYENKYNVWIQRSHLCHWPFSCLVASVTPKGHKRSPWKECRTRVKKEKNENREGTQGPVCGISPIVWEARRGNMLHACVNHLLLPELSEYRPATLKIQVWAVEKEFYCTLMWSKEAGWEIPFNSLSFMFGLLLMPVYLFLFVRATFDQSISVCVCVCLVFHMPDSLLAHW